MTPAVGTPVVDARAVVTPSDAYDARLALGATGVLREFNRAGVLDASDVHVATRLGALGRESDERVVLAVALAVRAVRLGSVCLDLATARDTVTVDAEFDGDTVAVTDGRGGQAAALLSDLAWPDPASWVAAVRESPVVADGPSAADRPLRLVEGLLYLDRYWREEQLVRHELDERTGRAAPALDVARALAALDRLFTQPQAALQRLATATFAASPLTVLAGGPGTGKSTTVARMLAVAHDQPGPRLRIALAAPTGKAAARLQEAITAAVAEPGFPAADRERMGVVTAATLHRLLGPLPGSRSRFRHGRDNRLPFDVVVVDETSMVSLTLMARLFAAVRPDARLVLVGDPDQLASVEVGAVLGDIVARGPHRPAVTAAGPSLSDAASGDDTFAQLAGPVLTADHEPAVVAARTSRVVRLSHNWRSGSGPIDALARAIRSGEPDPVLAALHSGGAVEFAEVLDGEPTPVLTHLAQTVAAAGREVWQAAAAGDTIAALTALNRHRVLCAHRRGPFGIGEWSARIEAWLRAANPGYGTDGLGVEGPWYVGRPVLVTANNYDLGLYNGDTGVVLSADAGQAPRVGFVGADGPRVISATWLGDDVVTLHAMTVHRAQGSEFDQVTVVLPQPGSRLLTRELLYTAVTRARSRVRVIGTTQAVVEAVGRRVVRASGLRVDLGS